MDFKGFMKGPILFDRKKCSTRQLTYNFDVIAENCHILSMCEIHLSLIFRAMIISSTSVKGCN